jgi:hypothetical protein
MTENIRPEISSGDVVVGSELDCRPPVGVDEDFIGQPVRDELLPNSCARPAVLTNSVSQLCLATGLLDGTLQSGNVVLLHNPSVTRNLVRVNKNACLTPDKGSCTVLDMPTIKKKSPRARVVSAKPSRRVEPLVGPDGFTMSQRVVQLMNEHGMSQTELARACSGYYAALMPTEPERVKQQHIFNIVQGQDSSWVVPLIAAVFDVSVLWLQFGFGKRERKTN